MTYVEARYNWARAEHISPAPCPEEFEWHGASRCLKVAPFIGCPSRGPPGVGPLGPVLTQAHAQDPARRNHAERCRGGRPVLLPRTPRSDLPILAIRAPPPTSSAPAARAGRAARAFAHGLRPTGPP